MADGILVLMDSDTNLVSENISEMANALANAANPELIEGFLYSLLTPSEADEIAKRWALVKDLSRGRPQRDIAKELGLSLCKITRGSRELKKDGSPFRRMLEIAGYQVPVDFSARKNRGSTRQAERRDCLVSTQQPSRLTSRYDIPARFFSVQAPGLCLNARPLEDYVFLGHVVMGRTSTRGYLGHGIHHIHALHHFREGAVSRISRSGIIEGGVVL